VAEAATFAILIVPETLLQGEYGPSFLDRAGFRIRTAASHEEALRIADAWPPDLIVMGSAVEGGTPAEVCARLRARAGPRVKLLLISDSVDASEGPGDGASATDGVPDANLVEPVDPGQLLATVAELLEVSPRRAPRVAARFLASLSGALEDEARPRVFANVLSLSESGVRLESPCYLRVGAVGALAFVLPGTGERFALAACPRVILDEVRLHYGVEFVGVTSEDGARLRRFVAARLGRIGDGEE
jgi:DNA-binding response OmpR family regulator